MTEKNASGDSLKASVERATPPWWILNMIRSVQEKKLNGALKINFRDGYAIRDCCKFELSAEKLLTNLEKHA